jgi:hypothetical protein
VKNQYFGDKRDLLKYSLLQALAQGVPTVNLLTCIWLLTPPSANNDGNRHFRELEGSALGVFLTKCVATGRRDVRELANYMVGRPGRYVSYGDSPSMYFTKTSRHTYFTAIPDSALHGAVVFFDPDNGLEPQSTVTAAHLKYAELRSIFDRMDDMSLAVVYQHLPRLPATSFWPRIADKVQTALNCSVGFVASGDVGFLIALRDKVSRIHVSQILGEFRARWHTELRIAGPNYSEWPGGTGDTRGL